MQYRISILLTLALGISGGSLSAHEEGETAPSVLDQESDAAAAEAPLEEMPLEEMPLEEMPLEEMPLEAAPRATVVEEKRDVLTMPETPNELPSRMSLPQHGMKMEEVERHFGAPISREPAVGQPPITRWNYDGFSVFFEHRTVLHAVQKDRPAELYRKDELLPASSR